MLYKIVRKSLITLMRRMGAANLDNVTFYTRYFYFSIKKCISILIGPVFFKRKRKNIFIENTNWIISGNCRGKYYFIILFSLFFMSVYLHFYYVYITI